LKKIQQELEYLDFIGEVIDRRWDGFITSPENPGNSKDERKNPTDEVITDPDKWRKHRHDQSNYH